MIFLRNITEALFGKTKKVRSKRTIADLRFKNNSFIEYVAVLGVLRLISKDVYDYYIHYGPSIFPTRDSKP